MKLTLSFAVWVLSCALFTSQARADLGDPLPGLTDQQLAQFNVGLQEFTKLECADDGLGPVFTGPIPPVDCPTGDGPAMACSTCHDRNAAGGGSTLGIA